MKRVIWGVLVAAALLVGATETQASTINYILNGKVTDVGSALAGAFNLGETLQATLTYDSTSGAGSFPVLNYAGQFGNGVTIASRDPFTLDTTIYTVGADTHVSYRMYGTGSGVTVNPLTYTPMYVYLQLIYPTIAAPLSLSELLSVTTARGFIVIYDNSTPNVSGTFDLAPTATTPIPAALPLFASALGGLSFFGWRRRKNAAAAA